MRSITMLVTAHSGEYSYEEGTTYEVENVLAEAFAEQGYATFDDHDEQVAFNARFEAGLIEDRAEAVVHKRDDDAASLDVSEGGSV